MTELEEQFRYLPDGWVFDGELLLANEENLSSDDLLEQHKKSFVKMEKRKI